MAIVGILPVDEPLQLAHSLRESRVLDARRPLNSGDRRDSTLQPCHVVGELPLEEIGARLYGCPREEVRRTRSLRGGLSRGRDGDDVGLAQRLRPLSLHRRRPLRARRGAGTRIAAEFKSRAAVTTVDEPSSDCRNMLKPGNVSSVADTGVIEMSVVALNCLGVVTTNSPARRTAAATIDTTRTQWARIAWTYRTEARPCVRSGNSASVTAIQWPLLSG